MRVAHVNCLVSKNGLLGVEKKLALQARTAEALGLKMDFIHVGFKQLLRDERVRFETQAHGHFKKSLSTFHRYSRVATVLRASDYDLIVLRYSGGDFSCFSDWFRKNSQKIVTEHHTRELEEAYSYECTFPQKILNLFMEKHLGSNMIKKCGGLIAVTDEIKQYELTRARMLKPACTIPNGVLVEEIPFSGRSHYDGSVLNLLCLANRFEPWQGFDRILAGLRTYPLRKPRLRVSVVGAVRPKDIQMCAHVGQNANVDVTLRGRLHGSALEEVLRESHIGFSSLALFKKGMKEACALKTREYMARGLPFVMGHADPDLVEGAESFFLSVSADDSPINMSHVVEFAEKVVNKKDHAESMREFAREKLDWKKKMKQMWEFLENIYRGRAIEPR